MVFDLHVGGAELDRAVPIMNERTTNPNVVRRRVVEITPITQIKKAHIEDEEGPPSSIDVSRALASLRGPELERLEAIMRADEDTEG